MKSPCASQVPSYETKVHTCRHLLYKLPRYNNCNYPEMIKIDQIYWFRNLQVIKRGMCAGAELKRAGFASSPLVKSPTSLALQLWVIFPVYSFQPAVSLILNTYISRALFFKIFQSFIHDLNRAFASPLHLNMRHSTK